MHNTSGKGVDCLRVIAGITGGRLSPIVNTLGTFIHKLGVQLRFTHKLSDLNTPNISPYKIRHLPLIEHYLYPVSTAPINNPTKRN